MDADRLPMCFSPSDAQLHFVWTVSHVIEAVRHNGVFSEQVSYCDLSSLQEASEPNGRVIRASHARYADHSRMNTCGEKRMSCSCIVVLHH